MPETDLFSTCCAIQNLWLAARAEGIGVGWVSILDPEVVKQVLDIPPAIVLVAYLCVGYPIQFGDRPMLEEAGWESLRRSIRWCSWSRGINGGAPLRPNRSGEAPSHALPVFSPGRPRPIKVGVVA